MKNETEHHLFPDEKIVWRGVPSKRLILRPIDVFLIPFSLFWAGFAIFWNTGVWASDAPLEFQLFGIPFIIMGLYVTIGRFLLDIFIRSKTNYMVSNRRVLIFKNVFSSSCISLDIYRLPGLELNQSKNGHGTIRFGPASSIFGNGFDIWSPSLDRTPQFLEIDKVQSVYELIERQVRQT
jgi:hypothetical protein